MINISGFSDEISFDLLPQLVTLKELGMKYMCPRIVNGKSIADYTPEEFEKNIKTELDKAGIKFSSIGSPIGKIGLYNEEAYLEQLKKLENLVKIAEMMECKYIRIFSFFVDSRDDYSCYSGEVIKKLKGFLEKVEGKDIILIHENEKKIYGDIPSRVLEIYNALNNPQFKLCYDASNYIQCNQNPFDAYQKTKEYTIYYHMKDCIDGIEVPLGLGQGKIEEILRDLKERNYDGFLTLEPHTAKYALLRKPFYICPLLSLSLKNSYRVYREVDDKMGISHCKKVTRKDVFVWQFNQLTTLLDKVGYER